MLGVTSGEGFIHLSSEELELGLETEARNRLVSDLVTSTYSVHQKEIFSAILTGKILAIKIPPLCQGCGSGMILTGSGSGSGANPSGQAGSRSDLSGQTGSGSIIFFKDRIRTPLSVLKIFHICYDDF